MRLEISCKKKNQQKTSKVQTVNNMLLSNYQVTEEIKEKKKKKKNLEINEKRNTMIQNLWDATKAVLREKFIEIKAYPKKQQKSQTIKPYA